MSRSLPKLARNGPAGGSSHVCYRRKSGPSPDVYNGHGATGAGMREKRVYLCTLLRFHFRSRGTCGQISCAIFLKS